MNINIATNYPVDAAGEPESFQSQIDEHHDIMMSSGFDITGPAVLVPEGKEYPGSYQVWTPCWDPDRENLMFVYVDPEGRAIWIEELPTAVYIAQFGD